MTKLRRAGRIITGILMIFFSIFIAYHPDIGLQTAACILGLSLTIYGVRTLIYYFRMARHMVGGKYMLYIGLIVLDFGMFTLALTHIPRIYVVLYLIVFNAFSGVIDILSGLEAKRMEASWKLRVMHGIMGVLIAVLCLVFLRSDMLLVYAYAFGLFYSACVRIVSALRKTAIIYIQ